jgi:molecular chaperone GrpE
MMNQGRRDPEPGLTQGPDSRDREGADLTGTAGEEILIDPEPRRADAEIGSDALVDSREREYLADLQRLTAEFANYRKRVQRERAEWEVRAKADLLAMLLPVLDDITRARVHQGSGATGKDAEGLLLIVSRFEEILKSLGLEVQPTEPGIVFDPQEHEALAMGPSEEFPEGTILDTFQPGYRYKGILLRPARVRVSQGPSLDVSQGSSLEGQPPGGESQPPGGG